MPVDLSVWAFENTWTHFILIIPQEVSSIMSVILQVQKWRNISVLAERRHCCFKMLELDYILVDSLQIWRASLVSLVALPGSRRSVRVYLVVVHTVKLCMSIGALVLISRNKISAWDWHDITLGFYSISWILASSCLTVLRGMTVSIFFLFAFLR